MLEPVQALRTYENFWCRTAFLEVGPIGLTPKDFEAGNPARGGHQLSLEWVRPCKAVHLLVLASLQGPWSVTVVEHGKQR